MKAEGFGEILTPAPAMPPCTVLLCKPPIGVSTPQAFRASDSAPAVPPKTPAMLSALESGSLEQVAYCLNNRFEDILRLPEITEITRRMKAGGALGACMTGSGSVVFGLFCEENAAQKAGERLQELGQVFLAHPVPAQAVE